MTSKMIAIEVTYGLPKKQSLIELSLPVGTTVEDAIRASGILDIYPEIDMDTSKFGVWNRVTKATTELRDGDRVEIYRPLIADPKEVRKRRAEKAVVEGRADKVTGGRPNSPKARQSN